MPEKVTVRTLFGPVVEVGPVPLGLLAVGAHKPAVLAPDPAPLHLLPSHSPGFLLAIRIGFGRSPLGLHSAFAVPLSGLAVMRQYILLVRCRELCRISVIVAFFEAEIFLVYLDLM